MLNWCISRAQETTVFDTDDECDIDEIELFLRSRFDVGIRGAFGILSSRDDEMLHNVWAHPAWITANGRDVLCTVHQLNDEDEGVSLTTATQRVRIAALVPISEVLALAHGVATIRRRWVCFFRGLE